jgi:hypothetical protein
MAVPAGFKAVEPRGNIPLGFKVISESDQTLGGQLLGAGNIAAAGVTELGKQAVEGLTSLGGLAMGKGGAESTQAAQALTGALPTVPMGENAQQLISSISEKFQASPEMVQDIFKAFSTLGPSIGDATLEATGSPALATAARILPEALESVGGLAAGRQAAKAIPDAIGSAQDIAKTGKELSTELFTTQSKTKQAIAQKLASGQLDRDVAGFKLIEPPKPTPEQIAAGSPTPKPRVAVNQLDKEALKQGFDKGVVASLKGAAPVDRTKFRKMVDIMERSKNNDRFSATNRPSDVLGDSLMKRVKVIQKANFAAGRQIDKAAEGLRGKSVDLSEATNGFAESLDELGVRLLRDDKGNLRPDFELSQLSPGDRGPLKEVIRQMNIKGRGGVDGFSAHKMKRVIDNNVTFGKTKTGLSGDAERALKSFRTGLDDALDNKFPEYNRVNTAYSETIGALDALQDVAGKKMNLSGPNADKATGTLMRRILSNAQSRVTLLDSINDIEDIAKKYERFRGELDPTRIEGPFNSSLNDDLLGQVLFVDELDSVFGTTARTSLQGQVQQGVEAAARAARSPTDAVISAGASVLEKARGINEEGAFKAIKKLLEESQ